MKVIVLGSGSAYGCPMIFNSWRKLTPNHPKNIRNRAAIYMEIDGKKFAVDCGPEFRLQINQNNITDLDAVFITHSHYDHIASVPELSRACSVLAHPIEVWSSAETQKDLKQEYPFLFNGEEQEGAGLHWRVCPNVGEFEACGVKFQTFQVPHHRWHCSAFRHQDFAYVTDWEEIPLEGLDILKGVKTLLLECNNGLYPEKNGHSDLENVKKVAEIIKPERVILTHLSARVDYEETLPALPENFELAYDGMRFEA